MKVTKITVESGSHRATLSRIAIGVKILVHATLVWTTARDYESLSRSAKRLQQVMDERIGCANDVAKYRRLLNSLC